MAPSRARPSTEYQPLWAALKEAALRGESLHVAVAPHLRERLRRMLKNVKWLDTEYQRVYHGTLRFEPTADGWKITLTQLPSRAVRTTEM